MAEQAAVHAPYNFVPFSNKGPLIRYDSVEELPRHDALDPKLKSGEIHVTMTARTPVFIGDGHKNEQDKPDPHFMRDGQGRFVIPGSSVRGMIRENMEILGFGLMRKDKDFEDRQIFFREMAAARVSTGGPLKEYYRGALGIESKKSDSGKSYSIPERVRAGYLYKAGSSYYIRPVRGTYLRISRKHPDLEKLGDEPARTLRVAYTTDGRDTVKSLRRASEPVEGMQTGVLLFTGKPVGKIANHLYIFPEADPEAVPVPIQERDRLSYAADWEDRRNSLKAYYNPDFWKLPEAGEEKPVFYIEYNGHVYFGMSLFLRIGYEHALSEGIPAKHLEKQAEDPVVLDYIWSMLGFAANQVSYRSRVSFADFPLVGEGKEMPGFRIILGQPKPSYYPGYTVDGAHYGEEFQLRGRKQYWLKEQEKPQVLKDNVATTMRPLPEDSRFRGVIRYRNLTEDELGLLLWALRLEKGCYQSIGMGKPYGYGRMELTIDSLEEFDPGRLYAPDGLCCRASTADDKQIQHYIDCYDNYAAVHLTKNPKKHPYLPSLPEIKQFFFLRSTVMDNRQVSYMELEEYNNTKDPLPDVKAFMEQKKEEEKEEEQSKPQSMDDLLAALAAKYKK